MKNFIPIIIATRNPHKIRRLTGIVRPFFNKVIPLSEVGLSFSLDEKGNSFEENAIFKANQASLQFDAFAVATDAGMHIPCLGKNWNPLQTKRFIEESVSDFERIKRLLELMKEKKTDKEREMHWEEAVALSFRGKNLFSYTATGPSGILQKEFDPEHYQERIWLCSLWYLPSFNRNYFELSEKEKMKMESNWGEIKKELRLYLKRSILRSSTFGTPKL